VRALPCPKELPYQFSAQTDVWWPSFAPQKIAILALQGIYRQKRGPFSRGKGSQKRHFLWRKRFGSVASVLISPFWPRKHPLLNFLFRGHFSKFFLNFWVERKKSAEKSLVWKSKDEKSKFFKKSKFLLRKNILKWNFSRPKWAD
jgi:hypothetical protein